MKIHIPTPLRSYTGGHETIEAQGATVSAALESLVTEHPAMRQHLFTAEGKLRSFVNLYLNDDDIRYLPAKEDTPAGTADELTIIPSIAGGSALDWSRCPAVESIPGKVSGAWVFRGTRMPVQTVFENLEAGMSPSEITEVFDVTLEEVKSVLHFATESLASTLANPV